MHGSGASLRNTSKHVINETIALCSERQENGTATTSKQAFNDFVLCGVTNNLPHPVKISLPLLCERDEQEVSAGHQQQTDNRSNRQRKTSKLRITKHLVGKQRGKHCNRRQTTHCSRLTNLSAKRQQQLEEELSKVKAEIAGAEKAIADMAPDRDSIKFNN
jgi:hypothetical protein